MKTVYEVIDHTADLGLRVWGKTKEELFANAAYGMFDQMVELEGVEERENRKIRAEAETIEELLVDFLRELLFLFYQEFLVCRSEAKVGKKHMEAEVFGERLNPGHRLKTEIKAVTYHNLKIREGKEGWQTEIIFDI